MAYTTINKSSDYFNTKLYTGTGSAQSITGVGFQPDLIWGKNRSATWNHIFTDAVRGANKQISSNLTNAEESNTGEFTAFGSDGFSVGTGSTLNGSGNNICSWNWKANGSGSANTDGSITSTVSANTTSGFSIVTYTGTSSNETVGHGLGVTPSLIIARPYSTTSNWTVWHKSIPITQYLFLNTTAGLDTANQWQDTLPTSNVFYTSTGSTPNLASGTSQIAYCFAEKQGFSKFGSYTGNANADGTFVYTGFVPAFVICKVTSTTDNWMMFTNKIGSSTDNTSGFNIHSRILEANGNGAEQSVGSGQGIDFVSNGFKIREDNGNLNGSGATYIYMAFAEAPLVGSNNIPCTAR